MAYLMPDPYRQAIRGGGVRAITYTIDASRGGTAVAGAQGLAPVGGSITDTSKPGVRRNLSLDLAPTAGLFDLLAPTGTLLTVKALVQYMNRQTVTVPMGVFDIDSQDIEEGGGKLSLTAPDRWVKLQRNKFRVPYETTAGMQVTTQIVALLQFVLGSTETIIVTATSTALVPTLTFQDDPADAVNTLAASIGAWVYPDRNGVFTIADLPTIGASADWLVDAGGVLTELSRSRDRTDAANLVVITSSATGEEAFSPQYAWDSDNGSSTYAGPDPITHPELAGPFGVVTYQESTSVLAADGDALVMARAILATKVGVASKVSLSQVPNPAVDSLDVLDVIGPRVRYDIPRASERHVVDTVTHPLDATTAQHIDGRSTRANSY